MITSGMMSSKTDLWATPQWLFDRLDAEFGFTLDVCATDENHKCARYFTEREDGLAQDWSGEVCWMNPPYGKVIGKWMRKAVETATGGGIVVVLVPARTDTVWWRDCMMKATEIRLVPGRLRFGDAKECAPFPSAIGVFGTPTVPRFTMMDVDGSERGPRRTVAGPSDAKVPASVSLDDFAAEAER